MRENLVAQVTGRVRWEETVRNMVADGNTHFVELGPGNVLAGLMRRIHPEAVVAGLPVPGSCGTSGS